MIKDCNIKRNKYINYILPYIVIAKRINKTKTKKIVQIK